MLSNIDAQLHYIYYKILSHAYNILTYRGVGAPVQGKYAVDGLSDT